ncbi:MAG: FAD-dependent oxidoreductase [Halanaerobiales bacterium]
MKYLVIGAGAAGISGVKEILKNRDEDDKITVITEEDYPFYYRPRLIEYLSGEVGQEEIIINDKEWFENKGIDIHLSERVTELDFDHKKVISDKNTYRYDKLLLANGAHSFKPPIKGVEKRNVFTLRNLSDAKKITKKSQKAEKAVVVGGGLLGVESASNLKKAGLDVTVVERSEWCLNKQLDEKGGKLLIEILEREKGLSFALDATTEEFLGDDKVKAVLMGDGDKLETDLVLLSTGVRSNIELFEDTNLEIKRAVNVNEYMETNLEDVYAAGDIAEYNGNFYGIWLPSMKMGQTAGKNMSGAIHEFTGVVPSHTLKVAGVNVVSAGNLDPDNKLDHLIEEKERGYKRVVRNKEGKAVGLIIVGQFEDQDKLLAEVKG